MEFVEFGKENKKTFMLMPGTGCRWQFNFKNVIDELSKNYHVICVNYDGFDGSGEKFTDMITVTEKIEEYIKENFDGRIDAVYGSSLGGSFVGLLTQRKQIHLNHGFIGSSDFDQAGKFAAKLQTLIIGKLIAGVDNPKKLDRLKRMLGKFFGMESNPEMSAFLDDFANTVAMIDKQNIINEYYSDLITPLEKNISVEGTKIHYIYALKQGKKYEKRCRKYYADPDIQAFDMQHEGWLFEKKMKKPVMDYINQCMLC